MRPLSGRQGGANAEDDVIRYLGADECRKQEQGMQGVKKDRELRTDARGFVREMVVLAHVVAVTTSDLKLKNAFVREGLALDQAQVMGCSSHERLVAFFLHRGFAAPDEGFREETSWLLKNRARGRAAFAAK
jgi:hypothetical protein